MAFSSLLDEPTVRERATRFTVEQYHLLVEAGLIGKNVELLEGILANKTSKSPLHTFTTEEITARLREILPEGLLVRQEQPITCRNSEPEPDIAVVRGARAQFVNSHPSTADLVVEVAVSSAEFDYQKQAIYASADVQEYWIILPEERRVEVHTRPLGREYIARRIYVAPEVVISETLPAFQLDLVTFFPR